MKFSILVFPGSNCDQDCADFIQEDLGQTAQLVWHKEHQLPPTDCVVIPGGFSYGDYLRCGAIARFSPIMRSVVEFAERGGYVIGICNGFQILTETHLLPGALLRNRQLQFICRSVHLKVENHDLPFTRAYQPAEILQMPIAHGEGNYFIEEDGLKALEDNDQIIFRYVMPNGEVSDLANPNGSLQNIAGISNRKGNVLGLMPHPERVGETILGGEDGKRLFMGLLG